MLLRVQDKGRYSDRKDGWNLADDSRRIKNKLELEIHYNTDVVCKPSYIIFILQIHHLKNDQTVQKEQRAISACYITFIARPLTNENARFRFNAK